MNSNDLIGLMSIERADNAETSRDWNGWKATVKLVLFIAGLVSSGNGLGAETEPAPLPEDVDHAGIISKWDEAGYARGAKLYEAVCITCHGTPQQEGTLPTSRPFWTEPFKNGNDPYSIYKTILRGFEQMPAWPSLTPELSYDVVHYIREAYLKPLNPDQYYPVTGEYLASLPEGSGAGINARTEGFDLDKQPKYLRMNFGPALNWTYEVEPGNIAYKGIAVRLDEGPGGISKGRQWMIYDHDTMRVAAAWSGDKFIDWKGIAFDGSHGTHARIVGDKAFTNPVGPGWAHPKTGSFDDPRFLGRDGKPYGPLPREWVDFKGLFHHGEKVMLAYKIGSTAILEMPGFEQSGKVQMVARHFHIGPSSFDLLMRIGPDTVAAALVGTNQAQVITRDGCRFLSVPAAATPLHAKLLIAKLAPGMDPGTLQALALVSEPPGSLIRYARGGPRRWNETVVTQGRLGPENGAFAVDEITVPHDELNPWHSWMRLGGFDFFADGKRAAVCTWMGDVWIVSGLDGDLEQLEWRRVASGLFQPLGLKIVKDIIYVTCRDQIARLHDRNGDGEIDLVENFNSDHQVTEHFHEFAMGLQTDAEGNFYYAKSARHALPAVVPHHGTLLKVSRDGSRTEIVAAGFRAANGVCVNDDGTFFVTDQEGHWTPKNRINRVQPGGFYGNMMGYHEQTSSADDAMEQPLAWITNAMDRSPGELVRVTSPKWGPLQGALLNLSYGTGRVFLVLHEEIEGQLQGGLVQLPIPDFPTGVMRGRFHPENGQLYACGMFAWAGNKTLDGGFYRVRYTGQPAHLPLRLEAKENGVLLAFSDPLDPETAENVQNYAVKSWSLLRTANYGSPHRDEKSLPVVKAIPGSGGKSVFLEIPEIQPAWSMEIKYALEGADGTKMDQVIHHTIHRMK